MGISPERLAMFNARANDPVEEGRALDRAKKISANIDNAARNALVQKALAAPTPRAKVIMLNRLADNLGAAVGPNAPCSKGCSHCCKMPVVLTEAEAKEIAKATGARLTTPKYDFPPRPERQFDGVACTFLVDGACSIYAHRPFMCRTHYVVDDDDAMCEIVPGEDIFTRQLDVRTYHEIYAQAFGEPQLRRMADVRRFFPRGLSKKGAK
jgi:Fe-S-cluster containining protein